MYPSSISGSPNHGLTEIISLFKGEKDKGAISRDKLERLVRIVNNGLGVDKRDAEAVFKLGSMSCSERSRLIVFAHINQALVTVHNESLPFKAKDLLISSMPTEIRGKRPANRLDADISVLAQKNVLKGSPTPCYLRSSQNATGMSINISTPEGDLIAVGKCTIKSHASDEKYLDVSFDDKNCLPHFKQPVGRNVWAELVMFKAMNYALKKDIPNIIVQSGTPLEQTGLDLGFIPLWRHDVVQNKMGGVDASGGSTGTSLSGNNTVKTDVLLGGVNEPIADLLESLINHFWSFRFSAVP